MHDKAASRSTGLRPRREVHLPVARRGRGSVRPYHPHEHQPRQMGFSPDPAPPCTRVRGRRFSDRLDKPANGNEIGMYSRSGGNPDMGLEFARDPVSTIRVPATYWRTVDRSRRQLISNGFAIAALATPATRWLTKPTDAPVSHEGGRQVGRSDLDELWRAADEARLWDSRYGGGNWKADSVTKCLRLNAAPLLTRTYTENIGRELFAATAELSRVVGWSAVDTGHHDTAQRHFIHALHLARAAGNVESGCYVMATMALQAFLRGNPEQAADMAEGAYERGLGHAAPRVLAFAKLAEARAHGRTGNAQAAKAALGRTEELLDSIRPGSHDPEQLAYMTHARLAADATEVHRDLADPKGPSPGTHRPSPCQLTASPEPLASAWPFWPPATSRPANSSAASSPRISHSGSSATSTPPAPTATSTTSPAPSHAGRPAPR